MISLTILTSILFLLFSKYVFGFTTLDPDATPFFTANMIPEFLSEINVEFVQKIVNNTGYNWRKSAQFLLLENESFTTGQEKTFDAVTPRDYVGAYITTWVDVEQSPMPLPYSIDQSQNFPTFLQLTTSYQSMYEYAGTPSVFEIKALVAGGFMIKNNSGVSRWITGAILENRHVVS